MITTILLISIFFSLYYFTGIFYLHQRLDDRVNFLTGTVMGFILSLPPIYFIHRVFNETFSAFSLKYNFNAWSSFLEQFYNVFLHVGILEEGTKLMIVVITILMLKFKKFNSNPYNRLSLIFLLFAGTSFGFSIIENVIYAYNYNDWVIIIMRSIISTIIHILCGVEMGYGFFKFFLNKRGKWKWVLYALFIPITIHSFYDSFLKSGDKVAILYFVILGTIFSYQWVKYKIFLVRSQIGR